MSQRVTLKVNGREQDLEVELHDTLIDVLRSKFKLVGPREGCGIGICGACTVLVDGKPISACLTLAALVVDKDIITIEGLADGDRLHPIQEAFIAQMGFQCSYCTPGFILATKALLAEQPDPTPEEVREYLAGNLCRCGSYVKILDAVLDAAARLRGEAAAGKARR
jgi:aerobic-type carbon monoxide dehydrogenase small subunit (CoxS/CutS family)